MNKLIFSLWTGANSFRLNYAECLVATLATQLAARHQPIELHADHDGVEIAKELGWPFEKIHRDLDLSLDAPDEVWAYGKLQVLSRVKHPTVHADLDVLLHHALPSRLWEARLCAQSVDVPQYYSSEDIGACMALCGFSYEGRAFNAGLIGGGDVKALRRYAEEAMYLALRFRGQGYNQTAASMVVEQFYLGKFSKDRGIKVETLFRGVPTKEAAERLGYNHLHGANKRDPHYVNLVRHRLRHDFPDALLRFDDGWRSLNLPLYDPAIS